MNDVNRDPIRWERSMTQDKDGQYVAYHDYAVLLESHDTLRAEVERLQKDDAALRAMLKTATGHVTALFRDNERLREYETAAGQLAVEKGELRREAAALREERDSAHKALQKVQQALWRWMPACTGGVYDDAIKNDAALLLGMEHDFGAREIGCEIMDRMIELVDEVERLRAFVREVNEADTEGYLIYVEEQDTAYLVSDPDNAIDDLTNHNAETMELIARPRRLEGV